MVKRMQHGFASRNGLPGPALAAVGYVGIKRVFEREYGGYLAAFGEGHHPDATQIYADLGTFWETDRITAGPSHALLLIRLGSHDVPASDASNKPGNVVEPHGAVALVYRPETLHRAGGQSSSISSRKCTFAYGPSGFVMVLRMHSPATSAAVG